MRGAAFFDLDRTLLDVNSGTLWLRAEWRRGRIHWRDALSASWWLARYSLGADDLEPALEHAASVYAGLPEARMDADVRSWFASEVQDHVRPGALQAIDRHRQAGDLVVLATSSSQYAATCAVELLDLDDAICTRLDVRDGLLTGRLRSMAFGRHKTDACVAWARAADVPMDACSFYTDSYSDLTLLEAVGRPVVIDPDRKLRRVAAARGWPIEDWGTAKP